MIEGGCSYGAIRYRIERTPLAVAAYHCIHCRRQSSSIYSVNLVVPAAAKTMTGQVKVFEDADTTSGKPVYREFCSECGSPIRSLIGASPGVVAVNVGTLDVPGLFAPGLHVFTRSRIDWVEIAPGVPQFA